MIRVLNMLPCMHLGGIETSVMNIYRHIERSKIQFDFAIFDDNNPNHYYEEEAKAMGARVFRLTRVSVNPIKALIHIKELLNLFKQNPDIKIVHIHRMGPGRLPLIIFLFMLCGIKIRIVHSRAAMPPKVRQKRATRFFLRTFSTHWLAVSNDAGRAFFGAKQWDRNTETQVFSGAREIDKFKFDHSKSQFTRETLGIDSNFVLAHVGRLTDEKNQAFLLEAFALALKENPQMVLLMVGGGPLAEDLSAKAATLGISDSVHFLGRRDDVADLLQAADLFVLPSLYEGLPGAAIEAQAAGLPCLLADTISKETKVIDAVEFLPIDQGPEIWAKAMASCQNFERRNTVEEVRRAGFDIRDAAKRLEEFYFKALEESSR